jgi:hypothetical protein
MKCKTKLMSPRTLRFVAGVSLMVIIFFGVPIQAVYAAERLPVPGIAYSPKHYICYRTTPALTIDGRLDEASWQKAQWTDLFTDIEGSLKPSPRFETRAKLLWDSSYLYIGAKLQEPDVWATLTQHDAVIYHDNDFEVFIDPDMDTHEYYELELNALNTVWDLLLSKPYRDGGPAVNAWDIAGLKTAAAIHGTLNHPGDTDSGWSVEIAIPWSVLAECAHRPSPPLDGDQWKINFSRVEWQTVVKDGAYVKLTDPTTGEGLPENNWVWSPQGLIAMHYPEMWGLVQFTTTECGSKSIEFMNDPTDSARWALRRVYYAEQDYHNQFGRFTADAADLKLDPIALRDYDWPPQIEATSDLFEAKLSSRDGKSLLRILQDGRVTRESR